MYWIASANKLTAVLLAGITNYQPLREYGKVDLVWPSNRNYTIALNSHLFLKLLFYDSKFM